MLRDIDMKKINYIKSLKEQIFDQFGSEFSDKDLDFSVGYYKGTILAKLLSIIQSKSTTQI